MVGQRMKNKLPRKRKKAYIKKHGSLGYMSMQIANEVMFEEKGTLQRFPEFILERTGEIKILFYW